MSKLEGIKRWLIGHWKGLLLGLFLATVAFFLPPLPERYRDLQANSSLVLTDRSGAPLRRQLSARDGVNHWVALDQMPESLVGAVLEAEDKRFYRHPGFDILSIARAALANARAGHVVSGASTITQQLLRTLDPESPRDLGHKLLEVYWAVRLEAAFSKDEILEAYLNRVSFGPSVYGAQEASRYYFDKPASALSVAESAALAVVIRSPSTLDPFSYSGSQDLTGWTAPLLEKMARSGNISPEQAARAQREPLELSPNSPPFLAPHFCDLLVRRDPPLRGLVTTSLDLSLQEEVEGMVRNHLALLAHHKVGNAAVLVVETQTGKIRAMVGSGDYNRRRDGQHNAATSLRQPGSTIKPFNYALLLKGTGQAGYILPDLNLYEDADHESFVPQNYDKHFHGPVSVRTALACSYNVPAVRALERVGVDNLLVLLQRAGFTDLKQPPDYYGLGLTLGDGSASLYQLVNAYRVLANGGKYGPLSFLENTGPGTEVPLLDQRICYLITNVLQDKNARIPSFGTPNALEFPFPVAVKTGTSKGYRDNWAIGYTPEYVVGVWVGNSDGTPMQDVSGITGAGPLFRDVMLTLGDGGDFKVPQGIIERQVCSLSGLKPNPNCPTTLAEPCLAEVSLPECEVCQLQHGKLRFDFPPIYRQWARDRGLPEVEKTKSVSNGLRFVFPQREDIFSIDPGVNPNFQKVKFRIIGGKGPFRWTLNGKPLATSTTPYLWWPLAEGRHTIGVLDSDGNRRELPFQVQARRAKQKA